jgi:hypothetical protein
MKTRALILLGILSPMAVALCAAQDQQAPPPAKSPEPEQSAPPAQSPEPAQSAPPTGPAPGAAAPASTFKYFFTASDAAFEAYVDDSNKKPDADGNKLVNVKLIKFSGAFRNWIKSNFPGGETADYAMDSYSIDCYGRKVGEHQITWYDASGSELTDYDFGGILSTPMTYSMKDNLMKKLCGLQ